MVVVGVRTTKVCSLRAEQIADGGASRERAGVGGFVFRHELTAISVSSDTSSAVRRRERDEGAVKGGRVDEFEEMMRETMIRSRMSGRSKGRSGDEVLF